MRRRHLYGTRRVSIGAGALLGNALAGVFAWIAVNQLCRGFLVALLVFTVLNKLTMLEKQQ